MMLHAFGQGVAQKNDALAVLHFQGIGILGQERKDRHKEGDDVEGEKATTLFRRVVSRVGHIEGELELVSLRVVLRLS